MYTLTNLTKVNAATATALVTITIGAITLTTKFAKGELSSKEYTDNLQQLGVETGVSAATATIGQALIPVPIVGALVGSMVGNVILGEIQRTAVRNLQNSQFLVDIEIAYTGTIGKIYESSQAFVNALDILAFQHKDFSQKQILDKKSSNRLKSLYDSI